MQELKINVEQMECSGCEKRIINALKLLDEVKEVHTNLETKEVEIIFKKEEDEQIKEKILEKIDDLF